MILSKRILSCGNCFFLGLGRIAATTAIAPGHHRGVAVIRTHGDHPLPEGVSPRTCRPTAGYTSFVVSVCDNPPAQLQPRRQLVECALPVLRPLLPPLLQCAAWCRGCSATAEKPPPPSRTTYIPRISLRTGGCERVEWQA